MSPAAKKSRITGRWHLVETDLWGEDSIDLLERARIVLAPDGLGSLVVGALQADVHHRTIEGDDHPIVEFSWIGDDDGHPASGRGSAQLDADRTIHVKLDIHRGDEATMVGVRGARPAAARVLEPRTQTSACGSVAMSLPASIHLWVLVAMTMLQWHALRS